MSDYLVDCTQDEGLDYVFGRMAATYGASFMRHWEGVDPKLVRTVWKADVGRYLGDRASMDYALSMMHQDFPPSSIAFRNLCIAGPGMRPKPVLKIERQLTVHEKIELARAKAVAIERLKELRKHYKGGE